MTDGAVGLPPRAVACGRWSADALRYGSRREGGANARRRSDEVNINCFLKKTGAPRLDCDGQHRENAGYRVGFPIAAREPPCFKWDVFLGFTVPSS